MKCRFQKLLAIILAAAMLIPLLPSVGKAAEFDKENFVGLVLRNTQPNSVTVKLYKGFTTSASYEQTPVYTEGGDQYFAVTAGSRYTCVSKPTSGYGRYHLRQNIYITQEEAAVKTVLDVTPSVRSTNGWDPSGMVYQNTDEVEANYPSDASLWPQYAQHFTTPAFESGRNAHQQTTQTEMMNFITNLDGVGDDMYVYILGKSGGRKESEYFDIPLVLFTKADISSATTLEEVAALIRADSEEKGKLTVQYQAEIHGDEPASCEAALGMIKRLDGSYGQELLDSMNIFVIPRLSPNGAYRSNRMVYYTNTTTTNPNGDFLKLRSKEVQLRMVAFNLFDPDVVFDAHEYRNSPESTSVKKQDLLISSTFLATFNQSFRDTAIEMAYAAFNQLEQDDLSYGWYTDYINGSNAGIGNSGTSFRGSFCVLMESQGIDRGLHNLERRVAAHASAMTAMLNYLNENAKGVKAVVRTQKQQLVDAGKTYEEEDVVVLDFSSSKHPEYNIASQTVNLSTGQLTPSVQEANISDVILRCRTAPTAYVIPAGMRYTQAVLDLMDKHGIFYEFIPADSVVELQQYGVEYDESGIATGNATLLPETLTQFPQGAYVFTMAQVDREILARLMEPDVTDSAGGTLVGQGIISADADRYPIYRYIHDLNSDGSIDYGDVSDVPEEPVSYTVYLKQSAADNTGDGYSEDDPVQTIEKAYSQLALRMEKAPEGTTGKIVLLDTYTLPANRQDLPTHNFPVEITGKSPSFGLVHPGGGAEDQNIIAFNGDTTLTNLKLTIQGNSYNNYISAQGHKLVIGQGVTGGANGIGRYFSLCGGDYRGTYASTDVTILSGSWYMLYAGNFASGKITGDASLVVNGAYVSSTIEGTYRGTIEGDVYIDLQNVTGTGNIYAGAASSGKISGDVTVRLGSNIHQKNVYATSSSSTFNGHFTVIADGANLDAINIYGRSGGTSLIVPSTLILNQGQLSGVAETFVCREDATIILGCDQTDNAAFSKGFNLDLNGFDVTGNLTVDGTVTVYDSATDDYDVSDGKYGQITGTVSGNLVAKEGYIAAANGFHKFGGQSIASVSLRPSNAGIYFTAEYLCDDVLKDHLQTGVVLSVSNDTPVADGTDDTCLWTEDSTSVMVSNIFSTDKDLTENATSGTMRIYARSYILLEDGSYLYSDTVSTSLLEVVQSVDTQMDALTDVQKSAINAMYRSFYKVMDIWNIPNIKNMDSV